MSLVSDFLAMGGYAFYVWTSYILTAVVLLINFLQPRNDTRRLVARLKQRKSRRSQTGGPETHES